MLGQGDLHSRYPARSRAASSSSPSLCLIQSRHDLAQASSIRGFAAMTILIDKLETPDVVRRMSAGPSAVRRLTQNPVVALGLAILGGRSEILCCCAVFGRLPTQRHRCRRQAAHAFSPAMSWAPDQLGRGHAVRLIWARGQPRRRPDRRAGGGSGRLDDRHPRWPFTAAPTDMLLMRIIDVLMAFSLSSARSGDRGRVGARLINAMGGDYRRQPRQQRVLAAARCRDPPISAWAFRIASQRKCRPSSSRFRRRSAG